MLEIYLEGLAVVERYWRNFILIGANKYCIQLKKDYVDYLLSEDQAIYMNFFDWMHRTSRQKALQSYDEYWRRLCQYFSLFARRRPNDKVYEQMRRFLNQVFPAERKLSRRTKKKDTLDMEVFCVTYRHHWVHSKYFPFLSDLPKHVSMDNLPGSVCYRDIELFYLKDPDSKRDILCALIEFRNLKGRPEVPKRLQSLPLRSKPETLNTPLLRRLERTPYGYELHESLSMTFENNIGHYNYRRWTANKERKRVLSQSGDRRRRAVCQSPEILELRREKRELMEEMRALAGTEDYELLIPDYIFSGRARLVEKFYGPGAEDFNEEKLLARPIQVTKDLVVLLRLCEPARRVKQSEEPLCVKEEALVCPTNVCILCYGLSRESLSHPPPYQFPLKRLDSLRRYLIDSHLALVRDGIKITGFLAHAVNVHAYDRPMPSCSDTSSVSGAEALESDNVTHTDTPLLSLDTETGNIDPRLLDS
ncbi:hypothetical protein BJX96DRAFT_169843 [Aspergillus floccosus]